MPGYSYKFLESIPRAFTCLICHLPAKDPVKITTCGHRFCDSCLQEFLSEGVFKCPEDKLPLDYAKIYADPDTEATVMSMKIRCIHSKAGCKWSDQLKQLQSHLVTCRYDAVPCTNNCPAMLAKIALDDHLTYTCPRRKETCEFCSREFTGEMLEGHLGSCQFEPVFCEEKCGATLQRRFLSNHLLNECSKRRVACKYCSREFVYETLTTHQYQCPRFPVLCPNRCEPTKIPRDKLETHLLESCAGATVCCMYKDMGCKFRGPRSLLQHHMDDSTSAHLALLTDVCLRQRQQISCLKTAVQSIASSTDGTTLFRITDFSARLSEARAGKSGGEVRSAPFYTHRYGYKLAASVFPNGNGCGDGTHLSVYMRLVPGEYDSLLEWPFMQTVSFTLFDQTECAEKRADVTESFAPEPGWRHFQRPSRDDCDNLGFGFPTFVSHSALKKRSYAKDDVVFIRVRVHSPKYIENSVI